MCCVIEDGLSLLHYKKRTFLAATKCETKRDIGMFFQTCTIADEGRSVSRSPARNSSALADCILDLLLPSEPGLHHFGSAPMHVLRPQ